jgi:hypothetical protein
LKEKNGMNNAAVAALLAVLVFVVLASVCAFPFLNCAKKEKFAMANAGAIADQFCPSSVASSVVAYDKKQKSTTRKQDCCAWSKDYVLPENTRNLYFKAGKNFENGVRYQVNFKDKDGHKIRDIVSVNGEVTPPPDVITRARSYWLTRVYPPRPTKPSPTPPRPK